MRNRIKVVIDTNIFIDGWFTDKPSSNRIMELIDERKLQLLFAQDTIGELIYVAKNFARHNLDDRQEQVEFLHEIATLFYYSTSVNTMNTEITPTNDPYDDMFLKCAIEGKAAYFITDDFKHGLHKKVFKGLRVISSQEFVEMIDTEKASVQSAE